MVGSATAMRSVLFLETVLRRCMTEGLVGGEGFAIDVSVVKADAHRAHARPGESHIDWEKGGRATRAVREYVEVLDLKDQQTQPAMRIEQHQKGEGDFRTTLESLISVASRAAGIFERSKIEEKRQLVAFVLSNLRLRSKKLEYSVRSSFDLMAIRSNHTSWLGD